MAKRKCRFLVSLLITVRRMQPFIKRKKMQQNRLKLQQQRKSCPRKSKGSNLLSRRRLVSKLTARGFEPDLAEGAADYLEEKGYLSEDDAAIRFAEQGLRKLWGPRRIREDLFARGFAADVVAQAMEELASVDFGENCALVISKKYGSVPEDPGARRKMVAALMRLGYTSEHIREAMRQNH